MENVQSSYFEEIAVEMVNCGANAISVGADCWANPNPSPDPPPD